MLRQSLPDDAKAILVTVIKLSVRNIRTNAMILHFVILGKNFSWKKFAGIAGILLELQFLCLPPFSGNTSERNCWHCFHFVIEIPLQLQAD